MTYGEIAKRLGVPQESREVGQAMGKNPIAIIMPCHRVLGADGKMGGFSANGGIATKRRILEIEGASAGGPPPLFGRAQMQRPNSAFPHPLAPPILARRRPPPPRNARQPGPLLFA